MPRARAHDVPPTPRPARRPPSPRREDFEARYRVLGSRDHRFDGCFFVAVTSTGIYCRPSCPAIVPRRRNVRFYPTAAAAQSAGFRACLRCHPHASPGSPEWNRRGDLAARAMGLIADGLVDREGVRPRAPPRLLRAPPHAPAHSGARRGPARARPRAARADRAHPDRDHRAAPDRRRTRRGLRERAPVQRHDPRGLRADPDGVAAPGAVSRSGSWGRLDPIPARGRGARVRPHGRARRAGGTSPPARRARA